MSALMWTDEKIQIMQSLYQEKVPLRDIAKLLRLTPGQVSGKLHRMGIMPKRIKTMRKLIDLKHDECRWPMEGGLFCAQNIVNGGPYCKEHTQKSKK